MKKLFFQKLIYRVFNRIPKILKNNLRNYFYSPSNSLRRSYIEQILSIPVNNKDFYVEIINDRYVREHRDPKLLAYYLPQFYPFEENDEWWGKGTTEWNNVSKAVPQYMGHYQPRLPGELGYYDLRIVDNIKRQVELAKIYGIYGFCFYYYWFDPKRLLDKPLDMFVNDKSIDFPFCLCWANESWAKRFWGTDNSVIMEQPRNTESYKRAIFEMLQYFKDSRYIMIEGACKLIIYKPSNIPNTMDVFSYWRSEALKEGVMLHIVGVKEEIIDIDLLKLGYDAVSEFQPGSVLKNVKQITSQLPYVRADYSGVVLDYDDLVKNKRYEIKNNYKTYRAIMPMWDNTARKDYKAVVCHGSTPDLYEDWLKNIIKETKGNDSLVEKFIFINAWNEWGEGAYLEPDRKFGYAYLQATLNAIYYNR